MRGDGDVAQMGERLPCTEEVRGSSPLISMRDGQVLAFGVQSDCHPKASG